MEGQSGEGLRITVYFSKCLGFISVFMIIESKVKANIKAIFYKFVMNIKKLYTKSVTYDTPGKILLFCFLFIFISPSHLILSIIQK